MSVYGIDIRNRNDKFLVNSNFSSLHYRGKASQVSAAHIITNARDGSIQSTVLGGGIEITYSISMPGGVQPYPFITCPRADRTYGVIGMSRSGNTWYIRVLASGFGGEPSPEVYVFSDVTAAAQSLDYGLRVWNHNTGLPSFDSSRRPISVKHTKGLTIPTDPISGKDGAIAPRNAAGLNTTAWSNVFTPDAKRGFGYSKNGISKPIFFFSSVAFAVARRTKQDFEEDGNNGIAGWLKGKTNYKFWFSDYWVFYRAGIRSVRRGYLETRWIPVAYGCATSYQDQVGYDFLNLGLIQYSGSSLNWSSGRGPFADGVRNTDNMETIILDGSEYG